MQKSAEQYEYAAKPGLSIFLCLESNKNIFILTYWA